MGEIVKDVVESAFRMSSDIGEEIDSALTQEEKSPMSKEDLRRLLRTIVSVARDRSTSRGENWGLGGDLDKIVSEILEEVAND